MQNNINTKKIKNFISPKELKKQIVLEKQQKKNISSYRKIIKDIIQKKNKKLLIICGPCSIHDINGAIDYAKRLKELSIKLHKKLFIIMRVYLEKPRTTLGWKGLINDPYMDYSYNIEAGLKISRSLLLELTSIGIPIATETLYPNIYHYINDLISWTSIGARTVESQIHRELSSGLPIVVGFKNGTNGNIESAINAVYTANNPHKIIEINQNGKISTLQTKGNKNCHIILRGGKKPNYHSKDIKLAEKKLLQKKLPLSLVIDCSHGNSNKEHLKQKIVINSILKKLKSGNKSIVGLMLESYINEGKQNFSKKKEKLKYGISITDSCINWKTTEKILQKIYLNINKI